MPNACLYGHATAVLWRDSVKGTCMTAVFAVCSKTRSTHDAYPGVYPY